MTAGIHRELLDRVWCRFDLIAFDQALIVLVINSCLIHVLYSSYKVCNLFCTCLMLTWDCIDSGPSSQVHHAVCLTDFVCLSVSFVVFHPFSCFASEKTAAVWIGGELNCSVRARSRLSSPWDNEMTINGKAVASRSFVRSLEEQQHGGQTETTAFMTDTGNCPAIVFILNSCFHDVVNPYIIHII